MANHLSRRGLLTTAALAPLLALVPFGHAATRSPNPRGAASADGVLSFWIDGGLFTVMVHAGESPGQVADRISEAAPHLGITARAAGDSVIIEGVDRVHCPIAREIG